MKYLADTHILLWSITNSPRLSAKAREIILDEDNVIFYSFANVWEVAIKHALRKPNIAVSAERFDELCIASGYLPLPTDHRHAFVVETLSYDTENAPRDHRDPFDRLLLAQAKTEGLLFLTHDSLISYYREPCVVLV